MFHSLQILRRLIILIATDLLFSLQLGYYGLKLVWMNRPRYPTTGSCSVTEEDGSRLGQGQLFTHRGRRLAAKKNFCVNS